MPLTPGSRLGPYEILSALGAGGIVLVAESAHRESDVDVGLLLDRAVYPPALPTVSMSAFAAWGPSARPWGARPTWSS